MHYAVLEISQFDLEVWCSETLPDAPINLGNLAGISVKMYDSTYVHFGFELEPYPKHMFSVSILPAQHHH